MLPAYPSDVSVCPLSAAIVAEGAEIVDEIRRGFAVQACRVAGKTLPSALTRHPRASAPPHLSHGGGCRGFTSRVKLLQEIKEQRSSQSRIKPCNKRAWGELMCSRLRL